MPYITQEDRKQYDDRLDDLCFALDEDGYNPGAVTYVMYKLVARWFCKYPSYRTIAHIRGVLIGTMTEFDRRKAAPYEDTKLNDNGDVDTDYDLWADSEVVEECEACNSTHCEVCNNLANQQRR